MIKRSISLPTWLPAPVLESVSWLADFRQHHWDALIKQGLPSKRNERWKYADLSLLTKNAFSAPQRMKHEIIADRIQSYQTPETIFLVLINGFLVPQLSDLANLPKEVIIASLAEAIHQHATLVKQHWPIHTCAERHPFANMNAAHFHDGLFLYVPDDVNVTMPIHLLSFTTATQPMMTQSRHLIVLGEQSRITLWEECSGAATTATYINNNVTNINVGAQAQLTYYKLQAEPTHATHLASTFVQQQQDSCVQATYFSSGGQFARDDIHVQLQAAGAACSVAGFYRLQRDEQYIDYHLDIQHAAPRTQSEMLYKGILDKKSRAVFNGRLQVEPGAQKILAYQANHNLLLSNEAEVNSKPELEIYADDVQCKHGATTGQLDQEALFYLQARGIERSEAVNMLLTGFSDDILQRVKQPAIKARIATWVCST